MTITITHKGTSVKVTQEFLESNPKGYAIIEDIIKEINTTCNNCMLDKSEGYGK